MSDTLLFLILLVLVVNTLVRVWNARHRVDLERVALAIYGDIAEAYGNDNMTAELARQQARIRFAEFARLTGFPLSARNDVTKRVVELTREEVKPVYIKNNIL